MIDGLFWKDKKVLVTGHTGFKGAWLSLWLINLGAQVTGLALDPKTNPNLYDVLNLKNKMDSIIGDICDLETVKSTIEKSTPDIVFHLAAQALVHDSYEDPLGTLKTNVIGTANILETIRSNNTAKVIINITSDKCYQNDELSEAFIETDPMGGDDPYSCSKGCSELITQAYRKSFYHSLQASLSTARAGNVIGGGDWSKDRLVPDIIKAFSAGQTVKLRSPYSIRPWQHVLEPLSGYMLLAENMYKEGKKFEGGWNFGPGSKGEIPVEVLTRAIAETWGEGASWEIVENKFPPEAYFLKLDCTKAGKYLNWHSRLTIEETIIWTVSWYKNLRNQNDMEEFTSHQISEYMERGKEIV